jgi:hypothetical protein
VGEQTGDLAHRASGSFFRPLASDDAQSGRDHRAARQIHEHRDSIVVEALRAGQKSRRQPLMFAITNAGIDRTSVCYNYFDYGSKVASGALSDDSFFAYICALDADDDPFEDESCWIKANPSLPGSPAKYLRDQPGAKLGGKRTSCASSLLRVGRDRLAVDQPRVVGDCADADFDDGCCVGGRASPASTGPEARPDGVRPALPPDDGTRSIGSCRSSSFRAGDHRAGEARRRAL